MMATRQTLTSIAQGLLGPVALVMAALVMATAAAAEEAPWQLQQQDDDILIYSRPVAGSSYDAVKATVLINAPISHVSTFIGDGNGCPQWRAMCKSSEVIDIVSEHERFVYTVLDLPWPASDRDIVVHSKTEINAEARTATVNLQSDSSRHPAADHVRAETSGKMMLRAVSEKQVEFTYIMHTELGGNLPASSVNAGVADGVFEDLSRLRQLAEG
jgi:hypothetical protein